MLCLFDLFYAWLADGDLVDDAEAEPGVQYREQEPEDPYREQELPEDFVEGKSNLFPFDHIYPIFQTQPVEAFLQMHPAYIYAQIILLFDLVKTRLDSHSLCAITWIILHINLRTFRYTWYALLMWIPWY